MAYFKFTNTVDGDEDAVFIEADDETAARRGFTRHIGEMPASMLRVVQVDTIPFGEEPLAA